MTDTSMNALFAPELVSCMGTGGGPNVKTLFSVACRVWIDGAAERSAFGWNRLPPTHPDRIDALRIAHGALAGSLGARA